MRKNVLITSSGSKVLLTRTFLDGVKRYNGKTYTADQKKKCATSLISDGHFQLSSTPYEAAERELLELINEYDIGLIVPTRDGELPFMSSIASKALSQGAQVLVCKEDALTTCQNKRLFSEAITDFGFAAIPMLSPCDTDVEYPLFIRPVIGSAGRGTRKVLSPDELPSSDVWGDFLFHPFISAPEYSIDLLMSLEPGVPIQCVVRERIEVVSGEAKVSRVVSNPELEFQTLELGRRLGLVGHNVVQAFVTKENKIIFIEVNPRFGGASNLSIKAGLNSIDRLLSLRFGKDKDIVEQNAPIKIGATMYRYSEDFIET